MRETERLFQRLVGSAPVRGGRGNSFAVLDEAVVAHFSGGKTMAQRKGQANVTGNGIGEAELIEMRRRVDALEAENKELRERSSQSLVVKLHRKGDPIGKTGNVRKADVYSVSGGRIGFPITHGAKKWEAIAEEMGGILEAIAEQEAAR